MVGGWSHIPGDPTEARRITRRPEEIWWCLVAVALVLMVLSFARIDALPASVEAMTTGGMAAVACVACAISPSRAGAVGRNEWLCDLCPVALVEQDWTDALRVLEDPDRGESSPVVDDALFARALAQVTTVDANPAARRLGLAPPGASVAGLQHAGAWAALIDGVRAGAQGSRFDLTIDAADGTEVVLVAEILSAAHPGRVVLAFTDVTADRRAEHELVSQLQAKDQFIATVSHELRTPLTAVLGLSEALRSGRQIGEAETAELLDLVVNQSHEVAHIVEDLLIAARADLGTLAMRPEPIALDEHVREALATFEIDIDVVCDEEVMAHADPVRVRQIVRNLVSNALRYGGDRRRIRIVAADARVVVEVRDSGPPLPDDDRERIFEPYQRARQGEVVAASVGLGLSVSRQLARLMGGELSCSHDGETVFRLELPALGGGSGSTRLTA